MKYISDTWRWHNILGLTRPSLGLLSYSTIQPSPTPTLDYLGPLSSPQSLNLGSISDHSVLRPWTHLGLLEPFGHLDYMTLYGLFHLDSIILLPHSLTSTCIRLAPRIQCLYHSDLQVLSPIQSPQILYLAAARWGLEPFLSVLLSAFSHCLVTILYKPIYCSCSSLVWISHLVSSLPHHCPYTYALNSTCLSTAPPNLLIHPF